MNQSINQKRHKQKTHTNKMNQKMNQKQIKKTPASTCSLTGGCGRDSATFYT
jgi:hypothetical protein